MNKSKANSGDLEIVVWMPVTIWISSFYVLLDVRIKDYTEGLKNVSDYSTTVCMLSTPPKRELRNWKEERG
jgi:hypothetical protein